MLRLCQVLLSSKSNENVPHNSAAIWNEGAEGDGSAGDIVCWRNHVGICDGQGNVIHSYHEGHLIVYHSIDQITEWNGGFLGYRRF